MPPLAHLSKGFARRLLQHNPGPYWNIGAQMVALNYQTPSKALVVNEALFSLNQRCGYVLRPPYRSGKSGAAREESGGLKELIAAKRAESEKA